MSIKEISGKIKPRFLDEQFFAAVLIVVVGVASFGLGRMSVQIDPPNGEDMTAFAGGENTAEGSDILPSGSKAELVKAATPSVTYVASKNSDKYHLPWCSGAKRISEGNKVYFASKEEAEAAGYSPAANCKGI